MPVGRRPIELSRKRDLRDCWETALKPGLPILGSSVRWERAIAFCFDDEPSRRTVTRHPGPGFLCVFTRCFSSS